VVTTENPFEGRALQPIGFAEGAPSLKSAKNKPSATTGDLTRFTAVSLAKMTINLQINSLRTGL
jgi:hypothetical protein